MNQPDGFSLSVGALLINALCCFGIATAHDDGRVWALFAVAMLCAAVQLYVAISATRQYRKRGMER